MTIANLKRKSVTEPNRQVEQERNGRARRRPVARRGWPVARRVTVCRRVPGRRSFDLVDGVGGRGWRVNGGVGEGIEPLCGTISRATNRSSTTTSVTA